MSELVCQDIEFTDLTQDYLLKDLDQPFNFEPIGEAWGFQATMTDFDFECAA